MCRFSGRTVFASDSGLSGPVNRVSISSDTVRRNNFDLIRLLAATQVVLGHGREHLDVDSDVLADLWLVVGRLPGVPIFFVISGFLISMSWERSPRVSDYLRNRFLRIYPALWVCLLVSVLIVFAVGYRPVVGSAADVLIWLAAQLSFAQFYNPSFLRDFGTGTLNGSLWTIPVELQFYLLVPLLYAGMARCGRWHSRCLVLLTLLFVIPNILFIQLRLLDDSLAGRLLTCSFVPWFYLFLSGVWCQRHWDRVEPWVRGRLGWWVVIYVAVSVVTGLSGLPAGGNRINPLSCLAITGLVLSAAFTATDIGQRLLKQHDISYGVYIYHMPVINGLLFLGITGWTGMVIMLPATFLLASLSWMLVERPALRLKRRSMREPVRA